MKAGVIVRPAHKVGPPPIAQLGTTRNGTQILLAVVGESLRPIELPDRFGRNALVGVRQEVGHFKKFIA